jgi:hypothetical protein
MMVMLSLTKSVRLFFPKSLVLSSAKTTRSPARSREKLSTSDVY